MSNNKDITMKDESSSIEIKLNETENKKKNEITVTSVLSELKNAVGLIEKTGTSKEQRFMVRALRTTLSSLRKKFTTLILQQLIFTTLSNSLLNDQLIEYLSKIDTVELSSDEKKGNSNLPEVEIYLQLLVTIFLIDKKNYELATECASSLINRIQSFNRRTLFPLGAKAFFYYSRCFELQNRLSEIRGILLAAHRTACLRHDEEGQATLLNLILRNYLHYNMYDQAYKFSSKTSFPDATVAGSQAARYLYYQGCIKSIQLEYTEAYSVLMQAIRKAPQNSATGFRLSVNKLLCIVQLLMGEIPQRSTFRQSDLRVALKPYLQLTQAVRVGDLAEFHRVIKNFADIFRKDKTYTLIQRLHHNVIKTGLRKINLAYSRIHLSDICKKLNLDNVADAEFIVAKAIKDGVIDAIIDHEGGFIQSKENIDIYSTHEPQEAFHKRISFCLNIHNEAVKAQRFPADAHKLSKESEEARKERMKQEQELAQNWVDEDDEDDEMFL
eukprot:TRINITY_DN1425_c0_g2_i1.p1 TRINITY_DN1425_c0_g2~~TRINITY_DN1425_c0_g2_i1.p1  ORF type:complete len:531 (-),score=208.54 TRINITY_DN1425_c0_g2_i1:138-1631(-)